MAGRQLGLEALIEADALAPGERRGVVGIIGGDEVGAMPLGRGEVGQFATLEALLAADGEPGLDERDP